MPEPVAHPPELEKAGADAEPQAGAEQQCQTERPPDEAVDHIVDARDDVYHMKSPSDHPKQKCGQNLFSKGSARKNSAYDPAQDTFPAQKTFALSFC